MDEIKKVLCEYGIKLQDMYNSFGSDELELVYDKDGVEMYYAPDYMYMDIIGLTDEQWKELRKAMGEIDHLEFNDHQIESIITALNYNKEQKIQDRIQWPMRPRFDFTEDDVVAIPIIINKLKINVLNNITYKEVYVIDSAIENYSFNTFNYDSKERKHYDGIHTILENYK
jgi:hypothetical protein